MDAQETGDVAQADPAATATNGVPTEAGADHGRESGTSRRAFLQASAGLMAGGAALQALPGRALAQDAGAADAELRRLQGARRLLLKGGVVLSLDPAVGDFAQADVLIEDGLIREVRPNVAVADDVTVIDATNVIVVPGFIDTHHHCAQGLLRSILTNGLLNPDYRRDITTTLTPAYLADEAYARSLVSALGMIDGGTTTVVDTSQTSHTPEHSDAMIRALQESGIRAMYAYYRGEGGAAAVPPGHPAAAADVFQLARPAADTRHGLGLLHREPGGHHGLRRTRPGCRWFRTASPTPPSRSSSTWAVRGGYGPGDIYIHCNHLSDEVWRMIRDTGGFASLSVPIEMAMGHGRPGIQEALDNGVRPSLSSDVDATMAQDPFTNMRAAFTLQRLQLLQRARNGEQNLPPLLTCREVLQFATVEGAGGRVGRQSGYIDARARRPTSCSCERTG